MRVYEERAVPQPPERKLWLTDIICSRCGEKALCLNGSAERGPDHRGPWGIFRGLLQGTGDVIEADLCVDCVRAVMDFIDEGRGPGSATTGQNMEVSDD